MLIDKLFVYGLLKKGELNYSIVEPFIITETDAYTIGTLYKLTKVKQPAFVKKGDGKVYGTLYYISNTKKLFPILDYLEKGYNRELIDVYVNGKKYISWIYVYKDDTKDAQIIEDGVWKNY